MKNTFLVKKVVIYIGDTMTEAIKHPRTKSHELIDEFSEEAQRLGKHQAGGKPALIYGAEGRFIRIKDKLVKRINWLETELEKARAATLNWKSAASNALRSGRRG